jgi:hypothetical protein
VKVYERGAFPEEAAGRSLAPAVVS